jgi:hypothetical protein
MPELVNNKVGSFFTTIGADGTMTCPLDAKKSKNCCLISELFIMGRFFKLWAKLKSYLCSVSNRLQR